MYSPYGTCTSVMPTSSCMYSSFKSGTKSAHESDHLANKLREASGAPQVQVAHMRQREVAAG